MFVITATFISEMAYSAINELLAMADTPERLAESLGISRDLEMVKHGIAKESFKQLMTEIKKTVHYNEMGKQIEEAKLGKSMARFLGSGFQEKQIAKLDEERANLGSLLTGPAWFYKQPRVRLLSAIRDYALDSSLNNDAGWNETDISSLSFPLATMFETADLEFAQTVVNELEKPLKNVDPKFILQKFEGNRSINFDLETGVAIYYAPAPTDAA